MERQHRGLFYNGIYPRKKSNKKTSGHAKWVWVTIALCLTSDVVSRIRRINRTNKPDSDNDYEVAFLKRSSKVKSRFVFPDIEVLAVILFFFYKPHFPVAQTARLSKDLGLLTVYLGLTLQPWHYFIV